MPAPAVAPSREMGHADLRGVIRACCGLRVKVDGFNENEVMASAAADTRAMCERADDDVRKNSFALWLCASRYKVLSPSPSLCEQKGLCVCVLFADIALL